MWGAGEGSACLLRGHSGRVVCTAARIRAVAAQPPPRSQTALSGADPRAGIPNGDRRRTHWDLPIHSPRTLSEPGESRALQSWVLGSATVAQLVIQDEKQRNIYLLTRCSLCASRGLGKGHLGGMELTDALPA